ncbi:MAG: hypothetical protein Q7T20_03260 [Saprospiraceae bacterium]|nr:hypothetical protein [Saprospiraceae bacterium]
MRPYLFVGLFLLVTTHTFAQHIQRTPARILDFGQLYSTFDWKAEYKAELVSKLGSAFAETVIAGSKESAWPAGIASVMVRAENRPKMAGYIVYFLTSLQENVAIMVVPATENAGMPANMKPASDFYLVVSKSAIALNDRGNPQHSARIDPDISIFRNFSVELNYIVEDFDDDFINMVNQILQEDLDAMVIQYGSMAPMEGSTGVYFMEDLMGASTSFYADYPGSTDPAVTLKFYKTLVKQVEGAKLSCCSLSKQEEQVNGNRRRQVFQTYDPAGKLNVAFQNMVIEVHIEQGETFDAKGQLVSNWIPVLSVYEQ